MRTLCSNRLAGAEEQSLLARSEMAERPLEKYLVTIKARNVRLRKLYATLSSEQRAFVDRMPAPLASSCDGAGPMLGHETLVFLRRERGRWHRLRLWLVPPTCCSSKTIVRFA